MVHLDEVRIQEEPFVFQDGSTVSYESDYTKFKCSMGGNIKFYDEHIALTSPRKNVNSPSRRFKNLDQSMESCANSSPARSALSTLSCRSMDMTPRIINGPTKDGFDLSELLMDRISDMTIETNVANEKLQTNAKVTGSWDKLKISDRGTTAQRSKMSKSSSTVAKSIAKVDSWKTDFGRFSNSPANSVEDIHTNARNEGLYLSDSALLMLNKSEKPSFESGGSARDYSPVRPTANIDDHLSDGDEAKPATNLKNHNHASGRAEGQIVKTILTSEREGLENHDHSTAKAEDKTITRNVSSGSEGSRNHDYNRRSTYEKTTVSSGSGCSRNDDHAKGKAEEKTVKTTVPSGSEGSRNHGHAETRAEENFVTKATASEREASRTHDHTEGTAQEKIVTKTVASRSAVDSKLKTHNNILESQRRERQDSVKMNRYNRILLYVNEQNETIQNGDYTELNGNLSDLSSDVFTDSEVHTSGFLSQSRDGKSDLDFYPDSPTTEPAFSKTPCSSRKNSLDSFMSDDSMSATCTNFKNGVPEKTRKLVPNGDIHSDSQVKQNGRVHETAEVKTRTTDLKNVKAKVGSTTNTKYKPGGGTQRIESKKLGFTKKTKPKINSQGNVTSGPVGRRAIKVNAEKVNFHKQVQPRTDTHCVEAYSHLPSEFQEIAKRLTKQDRMLRNSKTSGSSSSGRSRPHSQRSSHASSRVGSISPDRQSTLKPEILSPSTMTLKQDSTKNSGKRRTTVTRSPSIRSRPTTPSLSRSHPATFVTPYDYSRSRPSSRATSRSSSPVSRSRNTSPMAGKRSRGSSPVANHRPATTLNRKLPMSNRSKPKIVNGIRGRSTSSVGLSSIEIGLSSRSVFQVVPFHK